MYAQTTVDDVSLLNKTGSEIYQQFYRQASEYMVLFAGKDLRVAINQPAQWQSIPVCSSPLDIRFSKVSNAGKLTASVVCHGKGNREDLNWKQRLSVNIDFMISVVITPSYIKKGQVLNDLQRVLRPISTVDIGAVKTSSSVKSYEGFISLRHINAGTVITADLVKKPNVVQKGAAVTVVASTSAIMVTTEGTAMDSGRIGDIIKVKKNNGRIISCEVVSEQEVRPVSLQRSSLPSR